MRNIVYLLLFFSLSVGATDIDALWKSFEKCQDNDMPRQSVRVLEDISRLASRRHAYGDLLGAEFSKVRVMGSISADSVPPALTKLHLQAAQMWEKRAVDKQAAITACVYLTILEKWLRSMDEREAEELKRRLCENVERHSITPPPSADSCVMSTAKLLSETVYNPYKRIIDAGADDRLYANDMLSLLGHELGLYRRLESFYRQAGNMSAACIEAYLQAVRGGGEQEDNAMSLSRDILRTAMDEYASIPESSFLAEAYYDLMLRDDDISEATRYLYLCEARERYVPLCQQHKAIRYTSWIDNRLAGITMPQLSAEMSDRLILRDIRNITDVTITLHRINADGRSDLNVYTDKGLREVKRLLLPDEPVTIARKYTVPRWQTHSDTIAMPRVPYGVYLVSVKGDGLLTHSIYYHSDLALLSLPLSRDKLRLLSVSASDGRPVPGAVVVFMKRRQGGKDYDEVMRTTTDTRGEAVVDSIPDAETYYVCTSSDKAFRKSYFRPYFSASTRRHQSDILSAFTSRAIYRPGQEAEGVVVAYNAADENNIHTLQGKAIRVVLYDADDKELCSDTIHTDSCGNAPFRFLIPENAKPGLSRLSFSSDSAVANNLTFSIEEYRRPTFHVDVVNRQQYSDIIYIPDTMPAGITSPARKMDVEFKAMTYSGTPIRDAKVRYTISRHPLWRMPWLGGKGKKVIAADAATTTGPDGTVSIPLQLSLPEGSAVPYVFTVRVSVTDNNGETQSSVLCLRCCHESGSAVKPVPLDMARSETPQNEFELSSYTFPQQGDVVLTLRRDNTSSPESDAYVYYTLYADGHPVENSTLRLDTLHRKRFSYRPEYGDGLTISCVWIEHRVTHSFSATIQKPRPAMSLSPTWSVFRDFTRPGSEESWTLILPSSGSVRFPASLSATLYDKSLDAIAPHSWTFSPSLPCHHVHAPWHGMYNGPVHATLYGTQRGIPSAYNLSLSSFNALVSPGYARYLSAAGMMRRNAVGQVSAAMPRVKGFVSEAKMAAADAVMTEAAVMGTEETSDRFDGSDASYDAESAMDSGRMDDLSQLLRTSLGEAGFFFPSITADKDRAFHISFRMPETMTSWRLLGFVHDSSMRHAIIDTTIVSTKDLIVRPNVPRFVREKDRPVLSVSVHNATNREQSVETVVQLSSHTSAAPFWQKKIQHVIPSSSSSSVRFDLPEVTSDSSLVISIVSRTAEGFSDGERHSIPILPDTEVIRRTIALTLHSEGHYECPLSSIVSPSGTHGQLTVETTADAAHLIRSAIPSSPLSPSSSSDAISMATSLYVSRLLSVPDTLSLDHRLLSMQHADGSWPWWQGMEGSLYTTVAISRLLARLHHRGCQTALTDSMLHRSVPYLMSYLVKETERMRDYKRRHPRAAIHPSETLADILYTISLYPAELSSRERREADYVVDLLLPPSSTTSLYTKAATAIILNINGHKKAARSHLASLLEYSVSTAGAGRWFESPRAPYSWRAYRIPTVVAAIEAMSHVMPDSLHLIDEMRQWLLHERRAQQWDTSLDTADAIYAFLSTAGDTSASASQASLQPTLTVVYKDRQREDTLIANAPHLQPAVPAAPDTIGTLPSWRAPGRLQSATLSSPHPDGRLLIERTGKGVSWVAVSVSQHLPLSSFVSRGDGSGLHIRREIMLPSGGAPLSSSATRRLPLGTRVIVRLTIVADRDCDFVVVRDSRAASLSPVVQTSGYCRAHSSGTAYGSLTGYYRTTGDSQTVFYLDKVPKGTHTIETEYTIDREGQHHSGTATVSCAYAPEFSAVEGQYSM